MHQINRALQAQNNPNKKNLNDSQFARTNNLLFEPKVKRVFIFLKGVKSMSQKSTLKSTITISTSARSIW